MRISRQSFDRRRSSLVAIISTIIPANGSNFRSIGRLPLTILAGALLFITFSFSTKFNHSFGNIQYGNNIEDGPRVESSLRGPKDVGISLSLNEVGINSAISKIGVISPRKQKLSPPENASFIVFYNLFIPLEKADAVNAIEVLTEQLSQVASSLRLLENNKSENKQKSAVVFYNLIGNEHIYPPEKMAGLCHGLHPRLSCQLLKFYETASEAATLHDIYEYCHNDDNAAVQRTDNDTRVVYIHSKGSYHPSYQNNYWRREMTNSVLHPDCLFPPDDQCDVCGAQFYSRFSFMFPGNMWTAKCSYIQKLLPPDEGGEYDKRKRESIIKFFKLRLWGHLDATLMEDRVDYYGLGRYRLEHWVAGHASVRPCELHRKNVTFARMLKGRVEPPYDYEWSIGPPRNEVNTEVSNARVKLERNEDAQFREYYFLPGNLIKWFTLYGEEGIPAQNSWVWDFFPAGQKWKQLVGEFGVNAVEEMAKQSSPGNRSAFVQNNDENFGYNFERDEGILADSKEPIVVFYHIAFPEGRTKEAIFALKSQFDVLAMGQYDIVTRLYDKKRPVIIYYTIAGGSPSNIEYVSSLCKAKSPQITCRKLNDFESINAKGETLHQLHDFCRAKPLYKVTYVTNQLPMQHGMNKTEPYSIQKMRAYTTATTSKMCLKSRDNVCNVCGVEFYPLPFQHFAGNMFTASCDYVKDLMPPKEFEAAMNDITEDVLIKHLERAYTTELTPFTPQVLGLDHYSIEHWIGSHPDFKPCDVAPVVKTWFPLISGRSYVPNDYSSSRVYDFMFGSAPRRSTSPPTKYSFSEWKEWRLNRRNEFVFREYYYMAGNLYKWYKLYNKAPPANSWVWQWFPGGDTWRRGVLQYGSSVIEEITKPYTDEGVPH